MPAPGTIVRDALAETDRRGTGTLEDAFAAAHENRITGVPTFVYDGQVARGAVPPEHLERLVDG